MIIFPDHIIQTLLTILTGYPKRKEKEVDTRRVKGMSVVILYTAVGFLTFILNIDKI